MPPLPFAVYHEHPDWFRPLFAELERRGIPFVRLDPRAHLYDPSAGRPRPAPYSLSPVGPPGSLASRSRQAGGGRGGEGGGRIGRREGRT